MQHWILGRVKIKTPIQIFDSVQTAASACTNFVDVYADSKIRAIVKFKQIERRQFKPKAMYKSHLIK